MPSTSVDSASENKAGLSTETPVQEERHGLLYNLMHRFSATSGTPLSEKPVNVPVSKAATDAAKPSTAKPAAKKVAAASTETDASKEYAPARQAMGFVPQNDYYAGDTRSFLSSAMPIVEHGRAHGARGRHCGPMTMPYGIENGENLARLSSLMPLNDHHVVKVPKKAARPDTPEPAEPAEPAAPAEPAEQLDVAEKEENVFTPMNMSSGSRASRASGWAEPSTLSPMGTSTA